MVIFSRFGSGNAMEGPLLGPEGRGGKGLKQRHGRPTRLADAVSATDYGAMGQLEKSVLAMAEAVVALVQTLRRKHVFLGCAQEHRYLAHSMWLDQRAEFVHELAVSRAAAAVVSM